MPAAQGWDPVVEVVLGSLNNEEFEFWVLVAHLEKFSGGYEDKLHANESYCSYVICSCVFYKMLLPLHLSPLYWA